MILIQVLGAFMATVTVALIFGVPKKFLVYTGVVGGVGWLVYLILFGMGCGIPVSMFFAALVVALMSHSFARVLKTPVTIFLISGILPLVPGVGMYRIVYSLTTFDNARASFYFSQTMQISGMIALAIFIMDTIFRIFQKN